MDKLLVSCKRSDYCPHSGEIRKPDATCEKGRIAKRREIVGEMLVKSNKWRGEKSDQIRWKRTTGGTHGMVPIFVVQKL
jgi:hypothetical protein